MTQRTLSYRTNRGLFSNHYLRNQLPETEPWGDVDDVNDDLRRYVENRERAAELDAKIEDTDTLIDEVVYDLTDEEVEVVEAAVDDD